MGNARSQLVFYAHKTRHNREFSDRSALKRDSSDEVIVAIKSNLKLDVRTRNGRNRNLIPYATLNSLNHAIITLTICV
jgi:hypothetical protein